jgi:peptidoglycan/xylan/chitin deacetylase (PgdA/CDA1 family)
MNSILKLNNVVVMFHEVPSADGFRSIVDMLSSMYRMISAEELEDFYHNGKKLKNACHITFDDGHRTFYKNAFPVLQEKGIPASLFVSPKIIREKRNFWFQDIERVNEAQLKKELASYMELDESELAGFSLSTIFKCLPIEKIERLIDRHFERHQIGRPRGENMSVEQLLEVHRSGLVAVGAHTMNHPILKNEVDEKAAFEIRTSIEELADLLGARVRYFAYPNGNQGLDFDRREMDLLEASGIRLCFSTQKKGFDQNDHYLAIPRNGLDVGGKSFLMLKLLLGKRWYQLRDTVRGTNEVNQRKGLMRRIVS